MNDEEIKEFVRMTVYEFILLMEKRSQKQDRINKSLNDITSATFMAIIEIDELLKRIQLRINDILDYEENEDDQILH